MGSRLYMIAGTSLLTIAIVWALVLGWWQGNDFKPSGQDLVLYLGLLPLSLIGGFWLLRGFIEHLKTPAARPSTDPALPVDNDPLASASARIAARERGYSIHLLGSSVASGQGTSAMELLDAIAAGSRPGLDESLRNDAGFPVFSARIKELDVAAFAGKISTSGVSLPRSFMAEERLRALALLDGCLPALLTQAGEWINQAKPPRSLRVLWLVPADWGSDSAPALQAWLADTYLNDLQPRPLEVVVRPVADDSAALMAVDELILSVGGAHANDDLHLVIGANSNIGEDTLRAWSARKLLFSAEQQSGMIPGECAVALLFSGEAIGPVRLSRVGSAVRDKPVDAGGRVSSALLEQLLSGVLTVRGLETSAIKAVVADCDHRESRAGELLRAVGTLFDELDPVESCPRIGTACGALSPFGGLLALACAGAKATAEKGPVLCLSNQHPVARAALLVEPTPLPAGGAAAG